MRNTRSAEFYLQHKEHFDQRLVESLADLQRKLSAATDRILILNVSNSEYAKANKALKLQLDDKTAIIHNLKQTMDNKEKELTDYFRKQLEDLERDLALMKGLQNKMNEHNQDLERQLEEAKKENKEKSKQAAKENKNLEEKNKKLEQKVKELERKLLTDSSNSSMAPSSDRFVKVVKTRVKSERKVGGQKNHKGHHSKLSSIPAQIIEKQVAKAPTGAKAVYDDNRNLQYYRTQEINLKFNTVVTETRYFIVASAQELPKEEMKKYAINPVTYAPQMKALVLYLVNKGAIALDRFCSMLSEMTNQIVQLKPSTIALWSREFYEKSKVSLENILKSILQSKVAGVDETGWVVDGKRHWMHAITTKSGVYFLVTKSRGVDPKGPVAILKDFNGICIHDHFLVYYKLGCTHAECLAHVVRYLKGGKDFENDDNCEDLKNLLLEMLHKKHVAMDAGETGFSEFEYEDYRSKFISLCEKGIRDYEAKNPVVKKKYIPSHIKTFKRMLVNPDPYLMFIRDFDVPFTNNDAERLQRGVKAKLKISGQSKSLETANHFAAIHTIVKTCQLQNINTLEAFEDTLNGKDVFFSL